MFPGSLLRYHEKVNADVSRLLFVYAPLYLLSLIHCCSRALLAHMHQLLHISHVDISLSPPRQNPTGQNMTFDSFDLLRGFLVSVLWGPSEEIRFDVNNSIVITFSRMFATVFSQNYLLVRRSHSGKNTRISGLGGFHYAVG